MSKIILNERVIATTVNDYESLTSIPSINSIKLVGNQTSRGLNMYTIDEIDKMIGSTRTYKVVEEIPQVPVANTIYYVEPATAGDPYSVYLIDSERNMISLGTSAVDFSLYQKKYDTDIHDTSHDVVSTLNNLYDTYEKADDLTEMTPADVDVLWPDDT